MLELLALLFVGAAAQSQLTPGTAAPAFALASSQGTTLSLAEFRGEKTVVLAFFPKAFTGG